MNQEAQLDLEPRDSTRTDACGLTPRQRFEAISEAFFYSLATAGNPRTRFYTKKRQDGLGFHSEEDLAWHWACQLGVPVRAVQEGTLRAFEYAADRAQTVSSFRYCQVWIIQRIQKRTPL